MLNVKYTVAHTLVQVNKLDYLKMVKYIVAHMPVQVNKLG